MWFVNFFIDVANVIFAAVPLICYLGAGVFLVASVLCFSHIGNPAKEGPRDKALAAVFFSLAALLVGFVSYINAWQQSLGLPGRMQTGGALLTYRNSVPGLMGQTPQDWFLALLTIFLPFFQAWGTLAILRALLLVKDGPREGINVAWPFLGYSLGGAILINLATIVGMIFAEGA